MKKLVWIVALLLWCGFALAAVDINSADEKGLDAIKGIGPTKAKAIVDERNKNGPFKDLDDVAHRVKGIGEKTVAGWKKSGEVTVGGGAKPSAAGATAKSEPAAPAKEPPKAAKDTTKK